MDVELAPAELDSGDATMSAPTLYEWAGRRRRPFERLTAAFYDEGQAGRPARAGLPRAWTRSTRTTWPSGWPRSSAGPPRYTDEHGGYPHMLAKHRGLAITEPSSGAAGSTLICDAADDAGLPADPEFRSALRGLRRVGHPARAGATRSRAPKPPPQAPVPRWGWGEAPPYTPG